MTLALSVHEQLSDKKYDALSGSCKYGNFVLIANYHLPNSARATQSVVLGHLCMTLTSKINTIHPLVAVNLLPKFDDSRSQYQSATHWQTHSSVTFSRPQHGVWLFVRVHYDHDHLTRLWQNLGSIKNNNYVKYPDPTFVVTSLTRTWIVVMCASWPWEIWLWVKVTTLILDNNCVKYPMQPAVQNYCLDVHCNLAIGNDLESNHNTPLGWWTCKLSSKVIAVT